MLQAEAGSVRRAGPAPPESAPLEAFCSQPGVPAQRAQELFARGSWLTLIAEHHLGDRQPGCDLMGCSADPWAAGPVGTLGPPLALRSVRAPLYWYEWDLVAGRALAEPLWSVSCEPELLVPDSACRGAMPEAGRALLGRLVGLLAGDADAAALSAMVDALGDGGRLLHLAPLSPRGRRGLRLSWWVRADRVARWLDRIGFAGAAPELSAVLLRCAPPFARLGVQLEVVDGAVGDYLAVEARTVWQGGRRPTMDLERWLPARGTPGRRRLDELLGWVSAPITPGLRRQLYVKGTAGPEGWTGKAYAGVNSVYPGGPSRPTTSSAS